MCGLIHILNVCTTYIRRRMYISRYKWAGGEVTPVVTGKHRDVWIKYLCKMESSSHIGCEELASSATQSVHHSSSPKRTLYPVVHHTNRPASNSGTTLRIGCSARTPGKYQELKVLMALLICYCCPGMQRWSGNYSNQVNGKIMKLKMYWGLEIISRIRTIFMNLLCTPSSLAAWTRAARLTCVQHPIKLTKQRSEGVGLTPFSISNPSFLGRCVCVSVLCCIGTPNAIYIWMKTFI